MTLLLALALLQAPDAEKSIDDRIAAFLKGDAAARAELVKLGVYAIRPLQKVVGKSGDAADELVYELKKVASYPQCDKVKALLESVSCKIDVEGRIESSVEILIPTLTVPVYLDRLETARLKSPTVTLHHDKAPPRVILDDFCRQTGLDYGFFHNHVILAHPERLWPPGPPTAPRPLGESDERRVLNLIEKLNDESIEVRESAAKDLMTFGGNVIPLLKNGARRPEGEIAGRCKAMIERLSEPPRGLFGAPGAARQEADGRVQKLRGTSISMSVSGVTLDVLFRYLTTMGDVKLEIKAELAPESIHLRIMNQSPLDLLSLMTQSRRLDFIIEGDVMVVDTRDEVAKKLAGKK